MAVFFRCVIFRYNHPMDKTEIIVVIAQPYVNKKLFHFFAYKVQLLKLTVKLTSSEKSSKH